MTDNTCTTTIDMLRHGECEGGEIFRGTTDVRLTDAGWKNMECAIEHQHGKGSWEQLISSPLRRCRLFAEHLHNQHEIPLTIENGFQEMDFGDWEGRDINQVWAKEKETVETIYTSPHTFHPPNGEPVSAFCQRVTIAAGRLLQDHKGKHILLIQHGGTFRVLLTYLLSMPVSSMTSFHIPYACFSRVQIFHQEETDTANLVFHNILI